MGRAALPGRAAYRQRFCRRAGVQGLPPKRPGVTHMMMLDSKNLEIADIMLGWADKHIRKGSKK